MNSILSGVRVLDLSPSLAGQVATLLLAEAGADVIKVEPPGGDPLRNTAAFATWNRSKRSVIVDLNQPLGRARLQHLLRGTDAIVHAFTPARAEILELDDLTLSDRFPQLIVCSILAAPVGHDDAERPNRDILVQARLGLMDEQQGHRPGPIYSRLPLPSWGACFLAAAGVLSRLIARQATGRGGPAHTSLLQGALAPLLVYWPRDDNGQIVGGLPKGTPTSLYECADGAWIHVMDLGGHVLSHLALGQEVLDELPPDELGASIEREPRNFFGDTGIMRPMFRRRTSAEWLQALHDADIPALPVQPLGEVLRDEQARLNGYAVEVEDSAWGRVIQAGVPFHVTPAIQPTGPAPSAGQHDAELLGREREPSAVRGSRRRTYPLEGLRVLDFGAWIAGPFAAMALADLGADVVKVDAVEISGQAVHSTQGSALSGGLRGKRHIRLDLKHPRAAAILSRLVSWADVVHHNLRSQTVAKLGIDYARVRRSNPRVVYSHVNFYGPKGPRADWPGYDQLAQAYCGWEHESGGPGNPPMWNRLGVMDFLTSLASVNATLLGLIERARTGQGQRVATSILGVGALTASETMILADGTIAAYPRVDPAQTGLDPGYRIYEARDGWVAVGAIDDDERAALLKTAGTDDPAQLAQHLQGRSVSELLNELEQARVPAESVRLNQRDAFYDARVNREAGLVARYEHPSLGYVEHPGAFWQFGDLDLQLDTPPPVPGQHTREVLTEVGISSAEIDDLLAAGVVA